MKKLLIFHPTIAAYRIDFFNDLYKAFETRICLRYRNLRSQKFDYEKIAAQFEFTPIYKNVDSKTGWRTFYWKNLDDFNPDIVLVEEFSIGAIFVLLHRFIKRKKYKIISICDDSYNMVTENNDFSKAHKYARKIITPLIDSLILVEPNVTKWYNKNYKKGYCFPIIKSDEKARNDYKRLIPLSNKIAKVHAINNKKVFLFVGRLVALKNVEMAIRAFARLNQEENIFVIIGDGPERNNLEALAKELKANVLFTGRLEGDELNAWYNIARCFILPSYQEAFGAVTNEALLAGCKSLISNKAGSNCLISEGKNGYIIDPFNIDDIAEKMQIISSEIESSEEIVLKANNMTFSYNECITKLISYIKNI